MKSIDIVTSYSLEEALSCDDVFLEYFNKFLRYPSFPQRLCYSRFTGTFHDIDKETVPIAPICDPSNVLNPLATNNGPEPTHVYAARDDEKERVMEWAKDNRFPLFTETQLYRELKLSKLLIRTLDVRRGSSRIRGYSRLSMGYATTTSIVSGTERAESRALTSLDNQSIEWTELASSKFPAQSETTRPSSRAFSLPPNLGLGRTWSATAMYDTSATETSSTVGSSRREGQRPRTNRKRMPMTSQLSVHQSNNPYSDSGVGTKSGMDYALSGVGTSAKTRNIATRADTLGFGSRWESDDGSSLRTRTAMTSHSLPGDAYLDPASPAIWFLNESKYEGKSALRTADSPSKPHRATIVLPKSKPVVRIAAGSTSIAESAMTSTLVDDEASNLEQTIDIADADVIDDVINDDEFDDDVGEFLDFDERDSSCGETETEIASIEKVHSMSLQHIKERMFRTKSGMDAFLKFLQGTIGECLSNFWLDVEAFKDLLSKHEHTLRKANSESNSSASSSDIQITSDAEASLRFLRHRLFRDILDRHQFMLTDEAIQQIREAEANGGLSYHVFNRTQYDVLRRLRSYWLPRFVVHMSSHSSFKDNLVTGVWCDDGKYGKPETPVSQPCILPLQTIQYFDLPEKSKEKTHKLSVQTLESFTAQTVAESSARPSTAKIRLMSANSASLHTLLRALAAEVEAGFPFKNYIRKNEPTFMSNIYDFWTILKYLTECNQPTNPKSSNKYSNRNVPLDAVQACLIFTTFLSKDSLRNIGLPKKMGVSINNLDRELKKATSAGKKNLRISSTVFRPYKEYGTKMLSECLKRYTKHEISSFFESREGKSYSTSPDEKSDIVTTATQRTARTDEESTTVSETTTAFSRPWFTDDDTTETDSASTMYSYDVERIRQLASVIRQKGAKKPQRTTAKKAKKVFKARTKTAIGNNVKGHQASKVQFTLPEDGEESKDGSSNSGEGAKKKKGKSAKNQHPNKMSFLEIKSNKLLFTFLRKYISQCESVEIQNVMQMYQLCDVLLLIPPGEMERRNILSKELAKTYLHSMGPKQIAMPTERSAQLFQELPNPSEQSIREVQDYVIPTLNQAAANFSLGFSTLLKEYKLDLRSDLGQHMTKAELALRTLTLKPSSKRRRALGKHSARQTPTSNHKAMFIESLDRAKEGDLPLELVHFFKYLQGFGNQEGFPLIHNDLLFYVEVNKFLASFHDDHDIVTLKRKIISIRDVYIDSQMDPSLQIDVKTGTAERLRRSMDAFVNDKGREPHSSVLFDDSQHTVFNELLPFWAGFVTAMSPSEREGKRPVLKSERMHRRRLEAYLKQQGPELDFPIPRTQPKFDMKGIEFTFSVNTGVQWKAWSETSSSRSSTPPLAGVIEVIKAPPISQRRVIRRSAFTIRKLRTSKALEESKHEAKQGPVEIPAAGAVNKHLLKTNTSSHGSDVVSVVSYTTSVS